MSRNYTMIDDLEDISDMPQQEQRRDDIIPNDISEKIKGKIRNNYMAPPSSGKNYYKQQRLMQQMPPPPRPNYPPPPPPPQHYQNYEEDEEDYPVIKEGYSSSPPPATEISCKQIAEHIHDCPVCGRLYHHDRMNTMYIIIIVFLAIACLLLLKKNLNL